jgi:hypothetical protein
MSNEHSPHHKNEASLLATFLDEMNTELSNSRHLSSASPSQPAQVPHKNEAQSTNLQSKKRQLLEELKIRKHYLDAMLYLPSEGRQHLLYEAELSHIQQYISSVTSATDEASINSARIAFNEARVKIRDWEHLAILVHEFSMLLSTIIKMLQAHQIASEKMLQQMPDSAVNLKQLISDLEGLQQEVEKDSIPLQSYANAGVEKFVSRLKGTENVAVNEVTIENAKARFEQGRVASLTNSLDTYIATLPSDNQHANRLRQGIHSMKEKFIQMWKTFWEKLRKSTPNNDEAINPAHTRQIAMQQLKTQTASLFDEVTHQLGIKGRHPMSYHTNTSVTSEITTDPSKTATLISSRGRSS